MRNFNAFGAEFVCLFLSILVVHAPSYAQQPYPGQAIQLVISTTPGDTLDLSGRAIGSELSRILRTPVVPLNKTGASGSVGADFVVRSKKDGYTILYINSNIIYGYAANPAETPYNPFQDLEPVCLAVSVPLLIAVQAASPWKTIQELITYAKQNPGKLRGSSTGMGSVGHFGYEVIRAETGGEIVNIPYKGASPGMTALLGGIVEVAIPSPTLASPHVKSGKVRVLLASKRSPDFPQAPTLTELGYRRDMSSVWMGFFLPAGVYDSVKQVLLSGLKRSIQSAELSDILRNLGAVVDYRSPEEFRTMITEDYEMVKSLQKASIPASK